MFFSFNFDANLLSFWCNNIWCLHLYCSPLDQFKDVFIWKQPVDYSFIDYYFWLSYKNYYYIYIKIKKNFLFFNFFFMYIYSSFFLFLWERYLFFFFSNFDILGEINYLYFFLIMLSTPLSNLYIIRFLYYYFISILLINFFGLFPGSIIITANILFTLQISNSIIVLVIFYGIYFHQMDYLLIFFPKGVPFLLGPLLVIVEVISFLARALSLGIRLSANIIAGHTLLKVMCSLWFALNFYLQIQLIEFFLFFDIFWSANTLFTIFPQWVILISFIGFFFLCSLFLLLCIIYCLEIAVAFLQAYVFIVLAIMYFNEIFLGQH